MGRRRFMNKGTKTYTEFYFMSSDGLFYSPAEVSKMNSTEKAKIKGYALGRLSYSVSMTSPQYNKYNSGLGRVMSLYTVAGAWGWKGTDVSNLYNFSGNALSSMSDYDGKTNTSYISSQGIAQLCKKYNPGYKNGDWYLPAGGELTLFWQNRSRIESDFKLADVSHNIAFRSYVDNYIDYWTSTENGANHAYYLNTYYNDFNPGDKNYNTDIVFKFYAIPFLLIS